MIGLLTGTFSTLVAFIVVSSQEPPVKTTVLMEVGSLHLSLGFAVQG